MRFFLQDVKPTVIQEAKVAAYADIPAFLERCFRGEAGRKRRRPPPACLQEMMTAVAAMRFDEEPGYESLRQILRREMGRTSPRRGGAGVGAGAVHAAATASSEEDEEVTFSVQLSPAVVRETSKDEEPVTVSDEGREVNPRRRKKVKAARRLGRKKQEAEQIHVEEDDEVSWDFGFWQLNSSAPTSFAPHVSSTSPSLLAASDAAEQHAASAAEHRIRRRESLRQRSEASMRNPTPAMVRQARAMEERAESAASTPQQQRKRRRKPGTRAVRRATPQ